MKLTQRARRAVWVESIGGLVNFALGIAKLFVGTAYGSAAIFSDAVNSFGDSLGALGGAVGIVAAEKPCDSKHPFGYGKAEAVASAMIAVIVLAAGVVFAAISVDRILMPRPVVFSTIGITVVAVTAAVKIALYAWFRIAEKTLHSSVVRGQKLDCILDTVVTLTTLASYWIAATIGFPIDAYVGLAVAVLVCVQGGKLLKKAVGDLLGSRDDAFESALRHTLLATEGVHCVKDLDVVNFGKKRLIAVSLVIEASATTATIENALQGMDPEAKIYIRTEERNEKKDQKST